MSRSREYKAYHQWLSIALIIISMTMALVHYIPQGQQNVHREEATASTPETHQEATIVKLSDAIQTHFQVNLTFQSFLVEVVTVSVETACTFIPTDQFILSQSKSFKILLQRIISTNAP